MIHVILRLTRIQTKRTSVRSSSLGYVKYDDFWHFRDKWLDVYTAAMKLTKHTSTPIIEFPFEWNDKKSLMCWYDTEAYYDNCDKKKINKIYKLLTWCESPVKDKPCDKCSSCVRHNMELKGT